MTTHASKSTQQTSPSVRAHCKHEHTEAEYEAEGKGPCDVVMKGGITSGVVYPLALCELATMYRFKNLGGTSAGAIAAAAAAAAEYGRTRGRKGKPFVELANLPNELATRLPTLFQPSTHTRPLFALGLSFVGNKSFGARSWAILVALVFAHPIVMLAGTLPGAFLFWHAWTLRPSASALETSAALVTAFLFTAAGAIVAPSFRSLRRAYTKTLVESFYGLCTGMTVDNQAKALTPWLSDLLNDLAGKEKGTFLTFGDLWTAEQGGTAEERSINLEMMTTNITSGRPHRLPRLDGTFYFKKEEWRRLFPTDLIKLLTDGKEVTNGMYKLPDQGDLPVVIAVRMSLSFPGLLSAVPLYGIEHTSKEPSKGMTGKYVRSWFSDGGLISNFPIHFFDRVWPRWPTFGFNLCRRGAREEPWRPDVDEPLEDSFAPIFSLGDFAGALINAMQNWSDNLQALLPGYRERIVHIPLDAKQGGLNLAMSKETILELTVLGRKAASLFGDFPWDQHRWTRFVSSMHEFRDVLAEMRIAYHGTPEDKLILVPLAQFLACFDAQQACFSTSNVWRDGARDAADRLVGVFVDWAKTSKSLKEPKPEPAPELRISPRF